MKNIINKTSIKYLLQFLAILGVSFVIIIVANSFDVWNKSSTVEIKTSTEE